MRVFQRGGAFPGHDSEGGESQTGGGAQVCGAAEETVRYLTLSLFLCTRCNTGEVLIFEMIKSWPRL